ncbi:MAG: hypothetical protein ACUVUC_05375 [Thermoguttaceae bacterium]
MTSLLLLALLVVVFMASIWGGITNRALLEAETTLPVLGFGLQTGAVLGLIVSLSLWEGPFALLAAVAAVALFGASKRAVSGRSSLDRGRRGRLGGPDRLCFAGAGASGQTAG